MKKSLACRDSIIICEAAFPPYNPYNSAHSPNVCSSPPSPGFPTEQRASPKILGVSAQQESAEASEHPKDAVLVQSPV